MNDLNGAKARVVEIYDAVKQFTRGYYVACIDKDGTYHGDYSFNLVEPNSGNDI
jgi:hypothetical protein